MSRHQLHAKPARLRLSVAALLSTVLPIAFTGLAATPAHATASGGNGIIAFQTPVGNHFHIALTNADGSSYHVLNLAAPGMAAAPVLAEPAMSPDGTRIAFLENGGSNAIWTADVDGTHLARVTSPPPGAADLTPAWSPDGSRVFFTRTGAGPQTQIHVAFADGSGGEGPLFAGPTGFDDSTPDVAPNGDVAFTRGGARNGVYVLSAATGVVSLFAPGGSHPSYSPQGALIAYDAPAQSVDTAVYYRPANGGVDTLVPNTGFGTHPSWSPDGFEIVFQAAPPGSGLHLHVVDVNSGALTTVHTGVPDSVGEYMPSWQPVVNVGVNRVGGPDRIDTAIATARIAYDGAGGKVDQAGGAVLTRSDSFADALAGSALAAKTHSPLLLTATGSLDPRVAAELRRVLKPGGLVTLLGGEDVMSARVADQVAALGFATRRLAGPDRYATAAAIAAAMTPKPVRILVATGDNFPDALAAGAASGTGARIGKDTVVLLSDNQNLPAATRAYLAAHVSATTELYGIGDQGTAALRTMFPADRVRAVAGPDRYSTAAEVARTFFTGTTTPHMIGLAVGANWPDALAGGALLGVQVAPLLLADGATIPAAEADYAARENAAVSTVVVFGGADVVPDAAAFRLSDLVGLAGHRDYSVNPQAPFLPSF